MFEVGMFGGITSGLEITANPWTMSGQNWVLTGQIFGLPNMLSGHLRFKKIITSELIYVFPKTKDNVYIN